MAVMESTWRLQKPIHKLSIALGNSSEPFTPVGRTLPTKALSLCEAEFSCSAEGFPLWCLFLQYRPSY